jgi:hypothetical protein
MTLHWLRLDAQGASRLETLPALAMHYQGPVDAEGYRRRARGEEPPVAHRFSTSSGVRTIQLKPDQSVDILGPPARRLTFIVSGEIILAELYAASPVTPNFAGAEGKVEREAGVPGPVGGTRWCTTVDQLENKHLFCYSVHP